MAHFPRPDTRRLTAAVAALLATALAPAAGAARDLTGTWHVLVHYLDEHSAHPETPRWEDRLWVIEPSGSRLRWTDFPIVVFSDESGRFERRGNGQYARVLHYWEPSEGQAANIREGLAANDRGSRSKTLRKSEGGWHSVGRQRASAVNVITYQENWSIEGEDLPVFAREDLLASGSAENMEGRTEYRTTEVREGGDVLVGSYDRDGTRRGTFRMTRSGQRKPLDEKTQEQGSRRGLTTSALARQEVRRALEAELGQRGAAPPASEVDRLVDEALGLVADGVPGEEAVRRVLEGAGEGDGGSR